MKTARDVIDGRDDASGRGIAATPHLRAVKADRSNRFLEPVERLSEILFGLIMVLTFTSSLSIAASGPEEVDSMLSAAIGCNLAWGSIDAFMYLLACFVEQGRAITALRAVRHASNPEEADRVIANAVPPLLASVMSQPTFEQIRTEISRLPEPPSHPRLRKAHWMGGIGVFLAVFASTFPPVIPFLVVENHRLALRISNGIAVLLLFLTGCAFGRYSGYRPLRMGIGMAVIGSALVAITIELGG